MSANNGLTPQLTPLITTAAQDLRQGVLKWSLWTRLGWLEVKRRYRRTAIGPFWSAISLAVFILALGNVGSGLWSRQTHEYMPFLAAGMVIWVMVSTILTESCQLFISSTGLFRQMRFDYSVLALALVYRNFIVFAHNFAVYVVICVMYQPTMLLSPTIVLAVPGMAVVLLNAAWMALLLGMFCLRFRDVQQLINTLVQIAMFVTPIFWPPDSLQGGRRFVFVTLNPLYHLIEVARDPLLGRLPSLESCVAVVGITIVGWGVTYAAFARFRKRIAYWS